MRAVRLWGAGDLRVEEIDAPGLPEADAVLVRVEAAGICGSDLHNWRTGQWISRAPSTPGHEVAGEIMAVGVDVRGFAPGDRVVIDSRVWCGSCLYCLAGQPNLCDSLGYVGEVCDGGFAEALSVPARLVAPVGKAIDPVVAAAAEPLAVALHVLHRLGSLPGEPVLVAGCGPIGGLVALLAARGGATVLVADHNVARRERVMRVIGARHVELEAASIERALEGKRLRHAVEATGSVTALGALVGAVPKGATIAVVGIPGGRLELDVIGMVEREISLVGCSVFADELPEAIASLADLQGDILALLEGVVTLDGVPDAYRRLAAGDITGLKVVVKP